jgi:hypothetical protein
MPVASSIQELIDALKTRKTNITRALDDLFGNPVALNQLKGPPGHPHRGALATPHIFGSTPGAPLPPWARDELQGRVPGSPVKKPLSDDEIAHIENWPPQQKENLRAALDTAIENGSPLQFYWELYDGDSEGMDESVTGQVIFRTPRENVRLSGWFVSVKVKVGK